MKLSMLKKAELVPCSGANSGLPVYKMKSDTQSTTKRSALPATETLPDAFFGSKEALLDDNDDESPSWLGDRILPNEVSFLEMTLLDRLRRRPYHTLQLAGPIDGRRLAQAYADKLYRTEAYRGIKGRINVTRLLLCLGNGVFAFFECGSLVVYGPTPQAAHSAANELLRFAVPRRTRKKPGFHLLCVQEGTIGTEFVETEHLLSLNDQDLSLHYGDDFVGWHRDWLERLRQRKSGVSVLYGPSGCGKTTFLRSLMAQLIRTHIFYYLPISEFDALSSPRLVSFWARETNLHKGKQKIVILEDAEDLLLPRTEGTGVKVSNVLNIGDGFLGDHLRLHIIATTNVPIQKLDPAIGRPGRLIGARAFRRLSHAEAVRLARSKGLELPQQRDFSLAEIYAASAEAANLNGQRQIGFA